MAFQRFGPARQIRSKGNRTDHIELLAVLRERSKLDWMPCFDNPIETSWHIRLHAEWSLAISFKAKAIVDDEVAYGFSTSAGFPP